MKKPFFKQRIIRFRQFSNKAYSAFQSLHRQVTIGCVAGYIAEKEMLKSGMRLALSCWLMAVGAFAYAEDTEGESSGVPLTDAKQLSLQEVLVVSQKAAIQSEAYRLVTTVSRSEIEALPIQTVADVLAYLPGIDVRTRGANGSQADVSMRGGTFDQVLVMINGVNMSDAHTGHYALNLPISAALIERVEVLQGTGANLFGLNAFSGAINIVTRQNILSNAHEDEAGHTMHDFVSDADEVTVKLTAGMNNLINPELAYSGRRSFGELRNKTLTINASAEYSQADGYYAPDPSEKEQTALTNSDFRMANVFLQTAWRQESEGATRQQLSVQMGAQYKDAGAGMFYGFGSQDQFDATRTAFGSASYSYRWQRFTLEAQAAYRANYDRYEWHRGQRLYGNFHFSQNASASLKGHYASKIGRTSVGLEVRNENLHSTNLGDTVNAAGQVPNVDGFDLKDVRVLDLVKGQNRLNINYFAEQSFFWNNLSASLGVSGNYNTMFGNNIAGGANIGYEFGGVWNPGRVYLNANRSLRLPTFTDLYYNAGNQLGNRDLKPEKAWTLSLGANYKHYFSEFHHLSLTADAYYRWGQDIIDWVYVPDYENVEKYGAKRPYHAMNQQQVNAMGLEVGVVYGWNRWLPKLGVTYAYTYLDLDLKEAQSRYLDYLSHKLVFQLQHLIYNGRKVQVGADWALRFQKREGEYNDANGDVQSCQAVCLLDGSVFVTGDKYRLSVDCTNLTNRRYHDYGGLLQPGAWAKMTLSVKL